MPDPRDVIARSLMETATAENDLADRFLVGFVVIAEWQVPDGERELTLTGGSGEGQAIPEWTVQGYLHSALGGLAPWTSGDEVDDE